jgi:uncharacterized protein YndB with AHSA1/START domain
MKRNLRFEMKYPHPPEKVWQALTDAAAMSQWLMPNDFEPTVGHHFQFHTKPAPGFDGIVRCEVLEVAPPERLVYSWVGGGVDTQLVWTLKAIAEGTNLTLEHNGFKGLRGMLVSSILDKGWRSKILVKNLPALLNAWTEEAPPESLPETECHR